MNEAEELLDELFDAAVSGNIQKARKIAEKAIGQGLSADAALEKMTLSMRGGESPVPQASPSCQ